VRRAVKEIKMQNVIGRIDMPVDKEIDFDDPEIEKLWNAQFEKVVQALNEAVENEVSLIQETGIGGLCYDGSPRFVDYESVEYDGPEVFYVEGTHPELADAWRHCDSVTIGIGAENAKLDYYEDTLVWDTVVIKGKCAFKLTGR
jgi:hypothetical protein